MNSVKTGDLIRTLRTEKGFTQQQLAERINVSDRAVSKWERGRGCPDITLLHRLSAVLCVSVESILAGELDANRINGGNMNRMKFYVCPECGNILTAEGDTDISCCGRKLVPLTAQSADNGHRLNVTISDGEQYITFEHEMTKKHYLRFIAYASLDRILLVRLYPEQESEVCIPEMHGGTLYYCCSEHGLFSVSRI